jgi:hypothetical protein
MKSRETLYSEFRVLTSDFCFYEKAQPGGLSAMEAALAES